MEPSRYLRLDIFRWRPATVWAPRRRPRIWLRPENGNVRLNSRTRTATADERGSGLCRPRDGVFAPVVASDPPGAGLAFAFPKRVRAISTARLRTLPRFHLPPIYVVVSDDPQGDLILGWASRLDAFSAYPVRTRILGSAPGGTTDKPAVRPTRSSRTSVGSPQISNAHNR